ncbi:transposase, partial [Neisseria meningitidis]|nr:transposase [Neisseria meningitidis]MCI3200013.1 transposase [Neisseria meningitidis]MCI3220123.1 transposase [Neisseria meningitidis]
INKNQDKATKPQTVQIVRQGEATLYWFLLIHYTFYRISS